MLFDPHWLAGYLRVYRAGRAALSLPAAKLYGQCAWQGLLAGAWRHPRLAKAPTAEAFTYSIAAYLDPHWLRARGCAGCW